jgi:hypothetical protein
VPDVPSAPAVRPAHAAPAPPVATRIAKPDAAASKRPPPAAPQAPEPLVNPCKEVSELVFKIASARIKRVEVFHMRNSAKPRVLVSPEVLRRDYEAKLGFRIEALRDLASALTNTRCTPSGGHGVDVRWGVEFLDAKGNRVLGAYFDRWGTEGFVESQPVTFSKGLFGWVITEGARIDI